MCGTSLIEAHAAIVLSPLVEFTYITNESLLFYIDCKETSYFNAESKMYCIDVDFKNNMCYILFTQKSSGLWSVIREKKFKNF